MEMSKFGKKTDATSCNKRLMEDLSEAHAWARR